MMKEAFRRQIAVLAELISLKAKRGDWVPSKQFLDKVRTLSRLTELAVELQNTGRFS